MKTELSADKNYRFLAVDHIIDILKWRALSEITIILNGYILCAE